MFIFLQNLVRLDTISLKSKMLCHKTILKETTYMQTGTLNNFQPNELQVTLKCQIAGEYLPHYDAIFDMNVACNASQLPHIYWDDMCGNLSGGCY